MPFSRIRYFSFIVDRFGWIHIHRFITLTMLILTKQSDMRTFQLNSGAFFLVALVFWPINSIWPVGKLPVHSRHAMVVSASELASEIGAEALKNGGNAIDAAVATAFALAVTWPSAGNIGGGGFLVYHSSDGNVSTIDFREKAPLAATENMYLDDSGRVRNNSNHEGFLAIGVPGTVAGLYLAHQKWGRLPWRDLVEPAIRLAEEGIDFTWALHQQMNDPELKSRLWQYPSSKQKFYKADGRAYEPGERWKQPDLARTLERIREKGRDGFYRGVVASALADFVQRNGGLITTEDLAQYEAVEREPVHGTFLGYDIYSMPPPSSGGVALLEMLNILENFDLKAMGHNSATYLHHLTEAMRRAYADRARYLGDPDFNPDMPIDRLLSKEYAAGLAAGIDPAKASPSDSAQFNGAYESEQTTHLSVIDPEGNAVSLTYTLEYGYGSGIVAEGLGFLLNNEMGDFNVVPGLTDSRGRIGTKPNLIEPQKRMLSSMTPTIVAKNGKPLLVLGSPGGRTIINTVLQVVLNVLVFEMPVAQAVEAGRIHHQWLPDVTWAEEWALSPDTEKLYTDMGHELRHRSFQGRAMTIYVDPVSGLLMGAADSRSPDGGAAGF